MKILVTGGAGFIGSHLSERLVREGHTVVVVDNFDPLYPPAQKERNLVWLTQQPSFCFVEGDVRDQELMENLFSNEKFERVFHLAGRGGIPQSTSHPFVYLDETLRATMTVLEVSAKHSVKMLVNASSSSVYGNTNGRCSYESSDTDAPRSVYGALKKSSELLCHAYHALYGLGVVNVRFFSVYGPRGRPDQVVYRFAEKIFNGEPIPVFIPEPRRDFTYVDDIVDGLIRTLKFPERSYDVLNLGFGRAERMSRVISLLGEALKKQTILGERVPSPASDTRTSRANTDRAKMLLGWRAEVTLERGIAKFVEWYVVQKTLSPP